MDMEVVPVVVGKGGHDTKARAADIERLPPSLMIIAAAGCCVKCAGVDHELLKIVPTRSQVYVQE